MIAGHPRFAFSREEGEGADKDHEGPRRNGGDNACHTNGSIAILHLDHSGAAA